MRLGRLLCALGRHDDVYLGIQLGQAVTRCRRCGRPLHGRPTRRREDAGRSRPHV